MKPISNIIRAAAVVAVIVGTAAPARAQEGVQDLGTFKDWQAHSYKEGGKPVCTMFTKPQSSEGEYKKRGDVFVFVTHRPAHNRTNEVSVNIGYTFKKAVPVKVIISGATYTMFSDRGTAWTRDANSDEALVRAMRAGSQMVVEGISSRGTRTADSFSLSGFTAAHNAINKACKIR